MKVFGQETPWGDLAFLVFFGASAVGMAALLVIYVLCLSGVCLLGVHQ